jgi:hypothetical protein
MRFTGKSLRKPVEALNKLRRSSGSNNPNKVMEYNTPSSVLTQELGEVLDAQNTGTASQTVRQF